MSLYIVENHRSNAIQAYPSNWCFGDWKCGTPGASGTMSSPVIDAIPVIYACRGENFTIKLDSMGQPEMTTDISGNSVPVTCVCPIGFSRDHDLDTTFGSPTYGQIIAKSGVTPDLFVCDNMANGNPAQAPSGTGGADDVSAPANLDGFIAACDVATCQALWATPTFTAKTTVGYGKSTSVAGAQWRVKNGKIRTPPVGWLPVGSGSAPTYSSSILYSQ